MRKITFDDLMYIVEVSRIALEDKSIRAEIQYQLSVDNDEMERIFQLVEIHDDSFEKDFWSNIPHQDNSLLYEKFMNTLDMEDEEDYCLYERLTQLKENQ